MCPSPREKRGTSRNGFVVITIVVLVAASLRFDLVLTGDFSTLYERTAILSQVVLGDGNSNKALDATLGYRDDVNETIASCLMVMDDNHRLAEWIAYHYYAMPLRHLVILVDPLSVSSPNDILDKWRPYMTIEEWNQQDFLDDNVKEVLQKSTNKSNVGISINAHRMRQKNFVGKCAQHFKALNHTWVTFHDVDEYWVINEKYVNETHELMQRPGSILRKLKHVKASIKNGTLPNNAHYNGTCITTYRKQYGAYESKAKERNKDVPTTIVNPMRFDTLRWRYSQRNPVVGKSLVDVSQYPTLKNHHHFHKFGDECQHTWGKKEHYFRINHYVGSWESFNSRPNDRRKGEGAGALKTRQDWEEDAAKHDGGADDAIRPWIGSFVKLMGEERSKFLLQDVGVLVDYTAILGNASVPAAAI